MSRKPLRDGRSEFPGFLVVLGTVLALIVFSAQDLVEDRDLILSAAKDNLTFDANLLARTLEGVFRTADHLLDGAARDLEAGRIAEPASTLADLAARIPEAENVYLLDARGAVAASAYRRDDPVLTLRGPALADRPLSRSSGVETADAPAEGGEVVVVLRPAPDGRGGRLHFAVLFSSGLLDEQLGLVRAAGTTEVALVDPRGEAIYRKTWGGSRDGARPKAALSAEAAFRLEPLKVRVLRNRDEILGEWRERAYLQAFLGAAFTGIALALALYGRKAARRAREASELQRELEIKDTLFREMNHRIKNNLAIVSGILSLGETRAGADPASAGRTLRDCADRVRSMSLLHKQLYQRSPHGSADVCPYLGSLLEAIGRTYDPEGRIARVLDCEPDISLPMDTAFPLALLVNELVTNAYKYAFPEGRTGTLRVGASRAPGGGYILTVSDDGAGVPDTLDTGGFGTRMAQSLAAQIGGTLTVTTGERGGVTWTLLLP